MLELGSLAGFITVEPRSCSNRWENDSGRSQRRFASVLIDRGPPYRSYGNPPGFPIKMYAGGAGRDGYS